METVISTEAAHGIIVSSAAEKSASLPRHRSPTHAEHPLLLLLSPSELELGFSPAPKPNRKPAITPPKARA